MPTRIRAPARWPVLFLSVILILPLTLLLTARHGPRHSLSFPQGQSSRIDLKSRSTPVRHRFLVVNNSTTDARILRVRTRCTCISGRFDNPILFAGGTRTLDLLIESVDKYAPHYNEVAFLETTSGTYTLTMHGLLPPPLSVRHRPHTLIFDSAADGQLNAATIVIRAPKTCQKAETLPRIVPSHADCFRFKVQDNGESDAYRESHILVSLISCCRPSSGLYLDVLTACETIRIPVQVN